LSPNIIKRLEQACGVQVLGEGFPAQMVDDEPEAAGYEVRPHARASAQGGGTGTAGTGTP
jgi:3-hydroxyisobutyrate dehydrogenase